MATAAGAQRSSSGTNRGRVPKFLSRAIFAAITGAGIVNAPWIRQPGGAVLDLIEALKVPQQNRFKAQEQIVCIDETITSVEAEVSEQVGGDEEGRAVYLYEAQKFVERVKQKESEPPFLSDSSAISELEQLRKRLVKEANRQYIGQFAGQWQISEVLDTCEKQFVEARWRFWEARLKFYRTNVQTLYHSSTSLV